MQKTIVKIDLRLVSIRLGDFPCSPVLRVRLPVRLVEECDREAHERGQHQPQVQHLASGHACFSHRSLHPCHHSRKIATMIHTKKTIAKLTANTHRNPVSPISSPSLPKSLFAAHGASVREVFTTRRSGYSVKIAIQCNRAG